MINCFSKLIDSIKYVEQLYKTFKIIFFNREFLNYNLNFCKTN